MMQEIAGAIQTGASVFIEAIFYYLYSWDSYSCYFIFSILINVSIGFLIGAVLSGIAGYIGMLVSVRATC